MKKLLIIIDDFTILHIEASDEAFHQLKWKKKIKILEKISNDLFQPLLKKSGILKITIQADHGTSSLTGKHL